MLHRFTRSFAALALLASSGAVALAAPASAQASELPAYLQCVPYAREVSGIQIFGDAHTWWKQAAAKYERGNTPRVGAVMAFRPHRNMKLGHVAAVSKVVDSRTVLLDHANWSPINGRRGQIERDVKAIDVSPNNDWSQVRVWYNPQGGLGVSPWPVHGFIYGDRRAHQQRRVAPPPPRMAVTKAPSKSFASAFAALAPSAPKAKAGPARVFRAAATQPAGTNTPAGNAPARNAQVQGAYRKAAPLFPVKRQAASTGQARDPFAHVIARYDK